MDSKGSPQPVVDVAELYEHAPCGLLSTLPDGTVLTVNGSALALLEMTRADIVGTLKFQQLLTIGGRMYYETHYAPLLQMQGRIKEIALELRRSDQSVCPVVVSALQIRDDLGRPVENRIALFDATDRRRYERELLEARKQAERDAHDLADADRAKNVFIAMLAHELRNPLTPIRGAVEILKRPASAEVSARAIAILDRQVSQVARLVDDLLDVSRIREGKLVLKVGRADLRAIVEQAVEASEPLLRQTGLHFSATMASGPVAVDADAARMAQVIGNVLNNAVKFTPRGGTVALEVARQAGRAVITIRDTGIGMDTDALARVFDLFSQADDNHRGDGLGIGLTLARSLVERHRGSIDVSSAGKGLGTEVTIALPLADDAQGEQRWSPDARRSS